MEKEIAKINNVYYMKDKIIYNDVLYHDEIYYTDIIKYYIKYGDYYGKIGKYLILVTKDNKKHKICLGIINLFICIGDFEEMHLSFIKKMAPQAKFIKKEKITKKIKRKLKQIASYLKSDD